MLECQNSGNKLFDTKYLGHVKDVFVSEWHRHAQKKKKISKFSQQGKTFSNY